MHPARKLFAKKKPRPIRCKAPGCQEKFTRQRAGQEVCDYQCGLNLAMHREARKLERQRLRAARESKQAVTELNRRDLRWQHKQTQRVFNKMRVLEELKWFSDRGQPPTCISCGKPNMDWCCGHFKTVGAQGILRYDRNNTFLQCNRNCNMGLSGNIEGNRTSWGLKSGIILRFGKELGSQMIAHCELMTGTKKWEWEELEQARARYAEKIRELERGIA